MHETAVLSTRREHDKTVRREMKPLAFRLEVQSMSALLSVLTTVARLGCGVNYVRAAELRADISILAPAHVAHRVEGCLCQLIDVLTIAEIILDETA